MDKLQRRQRARRRSLASHTILGKRIEMACALLANDTSTYEQSAGTLAAIVVESAAITENSSNNLAVLWKTVAEKARLCLEGYLKTRKISLELDEVVFFTGLAEMVTEQTLAGEQANPFTGIANPEQGEALLVEFAKWRITNGVLRNLAAQAQTLINSAGISLGELPVPPPDAPAKPSRKNKRASQTT